MKSRGFTLVELVISIAISAIIVVFVALFMGAPVDAYAAHSRRAVLVADASGAWPIMESDLRSALPNSLRTRRNGNIVVVEMLSVVDVVRYKTPASAATITTAGAFRNIALPFDSTNYFLFVNNSATPGADAYSLAGSMTRAGTRIRIAAGGAGEHVIDLNITPAFAADSPRHRMYLLSGPVTYLCDEGLGTLRRYSNYSIAVNHAARDTVAELNSAGAASVLVTQGLSSCSFVVSPPDAFQSQTAGVALTSTTRYGDSVALAHSSHAEYLP